MLEKLKNLSLTWKLIIAVVIVIIGLFIFDAFTGQVRDWKNWVFDNRQAKLEESNAKLEAENAQLRKEAEDAVKSAIAAKAKEAVFDEREKNLDAKTKDQLKKTEQALEEQAEEEAVTLQPTDDFTRCTRTKEKMLALGVPAAKNITCEEFIK